MCANELKLTDNVKCDIAMHPSDLGAQLHRYFPETDDTNWIRYPFHALPPAHLLISEQESLIEIATSGSVKIVFNLKLLPDFWIGLRSRVSCLGKSHCEDTDTLENTYLCESGFSPLASMKTKYRQTVWEII